MNRYTIAGVTADAQAGRAVLIVAQHAPRHLDDFAHAEGVEKVYRANGSERVDFEGGGSVRFIRTGHGIRGSVADVVVLDETAAHSQRLTEDAIVAINARPGGEVIRP